MSATPDSTVADPEQRIADLERRLAEREAERDEALARETATAEVLQVINSSPGNLAPVFETILEKATRLCDAPFGHLRIWDGECFHLGAAHGEPGFRDWVRQRGPIRPGTHFATPGNKDRDASPLGRIIAGERVVSFVDVPGDERYRASSHPGFREMAEASGVRSAIWVALHKDDALLGTITVYRQEVRPFSDKQITLLQNFAAQAVIAIENARLITETREALEQQTATAEVLQVINASPGDLAPVFDAMLEKAMRVCGFDHGSLQTYDRELFRAVAVRGLPEPLAERLRQGFRPGPQNPMAGLLRGDRFVHMPDLTQVEEARFAVEYGSRSLLSVPLRKDGALLGQIVAVRQDVRPFGEKEVALLENFAAQAVIAMENARLLTETREALEQQTATAEVLGVINAFPGDLGPVFDAILEKAHTLCGATMGGLATFDGEQFHFVTAHGLPGFVEHSVRPSPDGSGPLDQLIRGEPLVHLEDIRAAAAYCEIPRFRSLMDARGTRTFLVVPLRKDSAMLGVIGAYRREVRPFTDRQIALLQNFAAQAVIAMENARLLTETREALEQQTATAEVLQVINSSPGDLTPVFDAILEKAHSLCGVEYGVLLTYDGELFWPVAMHGAPPTFPDRRDGIRPGSGFTGLVRGGRLLHIHDMAEFAAQRPDEPIYRELLENGGIRTQLAVPLRRDGRLLGLITANRRELRPFSDKEIALLENFAAQAVIAMENARLLGELRQRTEEVGELNRDLEARVAAQVDELGRVGRLKRFLAPQLAELIVSQGDEKILESHRREIVVVFCDLRGYTAFTETAEPEEVLDFLREYHGALGPLVSQFEGTLDQFSGDGIMVFFNDPVPIPDPAERAVNMAVAMREAAGTLIAAWRRRGRMLGFGAGIAQGYATLGQIGFADRSGYTAIGTVCNLAARLCAEAKDGQILLGQRVAVAVEETVPLEEVGELTVKGLTQPVVAYNIPLAAIQPALRVIEGGPQTV